LLAKQELTNTTDREKQATIELQGQLQATLGTISDLQKEASALKTNFKNLTDKFLVMERCPADLPQDLQTTIRTEGHDFTMVNIPGDIDEILDRISVLEEKETKIPHADPPAQVAQVCADSSSCSVSAAETLVNSQKSNLDDRSMNLVLYGITETDEEDLLFKVPEISSRHLQIQVPMENMGVTRIGTQKGKPGLVHVH